MAKFTKVKSDDSDAPDEYVVRVDLGSEEAKKTNKRYSYYTDYVSMTKIFNCSRVKVKNFIADRRTITVSEFFNFRSK